MKTIELSDREIRLLCMAIRIVLGQLNPKAKRIELDPSNEDLGEWSQLHMKVSCEECSLDENNTCAVCGAEWGELTPLAADGLMNWIVTTGLYKRDRSAADASDMKKLFEACAKVCDTDEDACG